MIVDIGIAVKTQELTKTKQYKSWLFKNNELNHLNHKIIAGLFYEQGGFKLIVLKHFEDIAHAFGTPLARLYTDTHKALYPHYLNQPIDESLFYI